MKNQDQQSKEKGSKATESSGFMGKCKETMSHCFGKGESMSACFSMFGEKREKENEGKPG